MADTFKLVVRTPDAEAFVGEVRSVGLTTDGGDVQCFANHASLTASVAFSLLVIGKGDGEERYFVRNGMFLFHNKENEATLLVLSAEKQAEVSEATVKDYLKWVDEKLAAGEELGEFQLMFLEGEKLALQKQLQA